MPGVVFSIGSSIAEAFEGACAGSVAKAMLNAFASCCAACLVLLTPQVAAQNTQGPRMESRKLMHRDAGALIPFDIPSQDLQDALDDFDTATGFSGLYNADAIAQRQSVAVQGRFTAEAALRKLLENTGLSIYFTARDAYVLEAATPTPDSLANAIVPPTYAYLAPSEQSARSDGHDFDALLQSTVREAFCRNALIAPGQYRIALSFRVTSSGHVEQVRLLDTTGNKARDTEILRTLRTLRFAHGPVNPAAAFVMLILPREHSSVADCRAPS